MLVYVEYENNYIYVIGDCPVWECKCLSPEIPILLYIIYLTEQLYLYTSFYRLGIRDRVTLGGSDWSVSGSHGSMLAADWLLPIYILALID